ncbi:hypothetical protein [Paenibacillus flagellatus]|uniref:Uncharacterized protein n=1 Tax=Paenibacillus flagellatus TaxID=2211139 RepID=A0A2V5K4M8_9BACL|nr:hypothetical protein [Paenibacillus flagellatus]PYI54259.1 hypothetical protein DLM86_12315 [Paenibacillus flagellatus]
MSTTYYFVCKKCRRKGGFYTRQAWGWGNFDIIDSFKFLAYHTKQCGEEQIGVVSEHNEDYEDDLYNERVDFYKSESYDFFPFSNDWQLMHDNRDKTIDEINALWVEEAIGGLSPDNGIRLRGVLTELEFEERRGMYLFKAYIRTEDGQPFTLLHMDRLLPEKGQLYTIVGELVSDEVSNMAPIGEIRGRLVQVTDMKPIA